MDSEWAGGIISEYDLLLQRKKKKKRRAETFTESPRNHLSLLLVSSIWCAIQPGAIQINTRGGSLRDWTPNGGGREADSDTFQMFYD